MTIQCAVCKDADGAPRVLDAPWICPVCGARGRVLVDGELWERATDGAVNTIQDGEVMVTLISTCGRGLSFDVPAKLCECRDLWAFKGGKLIKVTIEIEGENGEA